jgi:regulatory protein
MLARRRELTPSEAHNVSSALDVALRFLAHRPRSEREISQRLLRAGFTSEAATAVIASLKRHALVDDAAFASYWVAQRQQFRPRAARVLQSELRSQGVEPALAAEAASVAEVDPEDDAYRAGWRRARQLRSLDRPTFERRLGQFLQRRGYAWDTVGPVVDRLAEEVGLGDAPDAQAQ